jgi:hypothetical protein
MRRRIGVGSASIAVAVAAAIAAAPAAQAESIFLSISPGTQTVASGTTAHWSAGECCGAKPLTVTFTYGDGTSRKFSTSAESWTFSHVFHAPCTARSHTYEQKLTVVGANGGTGTAYTKTTVTYSGPLCS